MLMDHAGDVFPVGMFAYQYYDPLVSMVVNQGEHLAMPENKDERLSPAAKL